MTKTIEHNDDDLKRFVHSQLIVFNVLDLSSISADAFPKYSFPQTIDQSITTPIEFKHNTSLSNTIASLRESTNVKMPKSEFTILRFPNAM
jgi:hypothetical protein